MQGAHVLVSGLNNFVYIRFSFLYFLFTFVFNRTLLFHTNSIRMPPGT